MLQTRHPRALSTTLAALLGLALLLAACGPGGDPDVAATVNGEDIPIAEVESRFEAVASNPQFAGQVEDDEDGAFTSQVQASLLNDLIESTIVRQAASDMGVEINDADVEERTSEIVDEMGQEQFDDFIEQSGLTEEDVRVQIRELVLRERVQERLTEDIEVSDADVASHFEESRESRYERASARHILVETEEEAEDALERLAEGEDFAAVAEDVSTDPGSAEQGGDLGEFGRGEMVGPFDEAVFNAEPGELVGPVETDFGFHVIEVTERVSRDLEEVADEIRDELTEQERGARVQEWLDEQVAEAEVTVNPRFGEWDPEARQVVPPEGLDGPDAQEQDRGAPPGEAATPGDAPPPEPIEEVTE